MGEGINKAENSTDITEDFDSSGKVVLLVEDNLVNEKVALAMLEKMNVEVEVATNGLQSLEKIGESY